MKSEQGAEFISELPAEFVGIRRQLQASQEMGSVRGVDGAMSFWRDIISRTKDPESVREIAEHAKFVESGRRIEAEYGDGALLNLDHPWVQHGIKIGQYNASMVRAAEMYRRQSGITE